MMRPEAGEIGCPDFKGPGMLWMRVSGRKRKESEIQRLIQL